MSIYNYYTDGASSMYKDGKNWIKGPGGWSWVLLDEFENVVAYENGHYDKSTNNEQELYSVYEALLNFKTCLAATTKFPAIAKLHIDSAYVVNIFNQWRFTWEANDWKRKGGKTIENLKLIKAIVDVINEINSAGGKINFIKVDGHKGVKGNEIADKLAVEGKNNNVVGYTIKMPDWYDFDVAAARQIGR